jgi:glucose dehydrogenase
MKWKYFGAACVLAGYTLMRLGAPWYTVIAGIALAIAWNAFNPRANPRERRG